MEAIFVGSECAASGEDKGAETDSLKVLVCGVGLHHPVEGMDVGLADVAVVGVVHGDGVGFYCVCSWAVRDIVCVIKDLLACRHHTRPIAKIRYLIHIQPYPRKIITLPKMAQHLHPVVCRIWMEPVHKHRRPRPDPPFGLFSMWVLDEDVHLVPLSVSDSVTDFDAGVDDWHHVVVLGKFRHPVEWESFLVDGEILEIHHVVDICPDGVQGDVVSFIPLCDILQHAHVVIAPSALMEAHRPEWWHCRPPKIDMESIKGCFGVRPKNKPEVKNATNNFVGHLERCCVLVRHYHIHRIGIPQMGEVPVPGVALC